MAKQQTEETTSRLSWRAALRKGAAVGAVGLALGALGVQPAPALAAVRGWRRMRLAFDFVGVNGIVFSRDGGVKPANQPLVQGDHCNVAWRLHAAGDAGGAQLGEYHCFGPYTGSAVERGMPGMDCITVARLHLYGRGTLYGMVACCPPRYEGDGAVQGGMHEFLGALGGFTQGPVRSGVWRLELDLLLPDLG